MPTGEWKFEAMQRKGAQEARNELPDLLTVAEKGLGGGHHASRPPGSTQPQWRKPDGGGYSVMLYQGS